MSDFERVCEEPEPSDSYSAGSVEEAEADERDAMDELDRELARLDAIIDATTPEPDEESWEELPRDIGEPVGVA